MLLDLLVLFNIQFLIFLFVFVKVKKALGRARGAVPERRVLLQVVA